jgi:glycosyltransferase involved in cell wall biosynthesis
MVNGRFLGQRITGVQRYARELLGAIDRLLSSDDSLKQRVSLTILIPRGSNASQFGAMPIREVGRLQGQLWEQLDLPRYAGRDLLLNLCNTAPLAGRNIVATIHDASMYAVSEAYSLLFRNWYQALIPILGRRSRRIITVSQFSSRELQRYAGISPERISVVPGSGEHILSTPADESILDRMELRQRPYVLAVSSHSKHKNLTGVAQAAALLGAEDLDIVLAGGDNSRVFSRGPTLGQDRIRQSGCITDAELRALYEHASCLVYPSFYEGFGLPPLEAMACGCPVVVSRAASLPEVCGDAAVYCDPHDAGDIAGAIRRVLSDSALQQDLRRRGPKRSERFSWKTAAHSVLDLANALVPG